MDAERWRRCGHLAEPGAFDTAGELLVGPPSYTIAKTKTGPGDSCNKAETNTHRAPRSAPSPHERHPARPAADAQPPVRAIPSAVQRTDLWK